ncbi:hypothetical protein PV-S19_0276 [Pacmanvirus S19]|nr:hypothetical protein PV-S19_0276 [Pacmanvirus S19]
MACSIPYCSSYYYNKECNSLIKDSDYFTKEGLSIYYYRGCHDYRCGHNNKIRVPMLKINGNVIVLRPFHEAGISIPFRLLAAYKIKPKIVIAQFRKEFSELCAKKPNYGIYPGEMQHMTSVYKMHQVIKQIPSAVYNHHLNRCANTINIILTKFIELPPELINIIAEFIIKNDSTK